jgi:hypothetical protein
MTALSLRMQAHVMRPQMLLDISPQCLYHNIPMILIEQTVHPRRFLEETYYWFACPVLDCNQRYDMDRGYYTLIDGKLDDTPNKQPCPECSLRLYMAKRSATLADSVWLCANEDCPSNKRKT